MTAPAHFAHIYQKPAQGNAFIQRLPVSQYKHKISAMGGFDNAQFRLNVGITQAERILEQWVGNRIAIYVDNPAEPVWEGLINRIDLQVASVSFSRSIDKLYNRVNVGQKTGSSRNRNAAVADNTDSQAIYGIKQGQLDVGYHQSSLKGYVNDLRDRVIAFHAWPQSTTAIRGGSGLLLRVSALGFYHTLGWEEIPNDSTTLREPGDIISVRIVPNLVNTTTFLDNGDVSAIEANAAFTFSTSNQALVGRTAWDVIRNLTEAGDGAVRYIAGVSPTLFSTNTRRVFYRPASTSVDYTYRVKEGLKIRNQFGGVVQPWNVRPDKVIRVQDLLVGWNALGDDPRLTYIETVDYDAESQVAAIRGAPDTGDATIESALQLTRGSHWKTFGEREGALTGIN